MKIQRDVKCFWRAVKLTWQQFCDRTFIHGIRYIEDSEGNFYTHVMWLIVTSTSLILAIMLVNTFWEEYKTNPTRMNVESVNVPISELDFPAVTFCNVNRIIIERTEEFAESLIVPSSLGEISSKQISQWLKNIIGFSDYISDVNPDHLATLQDILNANNVSIATTMRLVQQSCSSLLVRCRWEGKIVNCSSIFSPLPTFRGFCCSFNALASLGIAVAQRTNHFGIGSGLSVVLAPSLENTTVSGAYTKGVRVLINEPAAYPGDRSIEKIYPLGMENLVRVSGEQTNCSDMVRNLPITDRKCYFPTDFRLKFFSNYRENNCDIECRIDETLNYCQCVPFFFPNPQNLDVCNVTRIPCLVDNYDLINRQSTNGTEPFCDCLSNCNGIYYDVRSNSAFLSKYPYSTSPLYKDLNVSTHMIVHVFFGSHDFMKLRRDLLSDVVVLIANLGGVFNLFLGISILTMLEVPYFATVRLYANYRHLEEELRKRELFVKRLHVQALQMKMRATLMHHK
ncbi:sodium channel protein Nach-like [Phlebotomus argentipes]|uniref:sodium channel protein Nach-like n=1 Tax=Phlebotomus argentipes TaxID=94469 RepID=UPI002892E62F|nr:sodium channel protein Nach-like [Phlebotomus argentipes]